MIAVLYKLEYASNAGYNDPACTSMPCGWNVSTKKDVQAGKNMDITIRKDKKTNTRTGPPGIISEWKSIDIISEWKSFDISSNRPPMEFKGMPPMTSLCSGSNEYAKSMTSLQAWAKCGR